ncbi:MAG: hypothetical protein Tsb0013_18140 [Phycisphaerales bacterium]
MNGLIKPVLTIACVSLVTLALAACGGGESGDGSNGANGSNASSSSGSNNSGSGAQQEGSAAYRVVDEFVTHMANRAYGEARELTDSGGGATILDEYIRTLDQYNQAPNAAAIYEPIFESISTRFASAGIEVIEEGDDTATVRLTLDGEAYDLPVSSIDGSTWQISIPGDMLTNTMELINNSANSLRDSMGSGGDGG